VTGELSLSIARVITVSVFCVVFPLVVCFTARHCSKIVSVDVEGRNYPSNLRLSPLPVLASWLLSY